MPALGASEFTELFATTLQKYERELIDNVLTKHPTLDLFKDQAKSQTGRGLVIPLRAARLDRTAVTDESGSFSTSKDGPIVGSAVYSWSRPIVTPTRVVWEELQQNTGKEQIVSLLKAHKDTAVDDHATFLAQGLHAATPATGMFESLATLVNDTGEVGGIDPSDPDKDYWKATVRTIVPDKYDDGSDNPDGQSIRKAFRTVANDLYVSTGGRHKVTHIIAGRDVFDEYEDSFDDKVRYVDFGEGQTKFTAIMFGEIEVRLDPDCPADKAYFLDKSSLRAGYLNGNLLKVQPSQTITGTLDFVTPVASVIGFGVDERRANGLLIRPEPEPAPE